MLYTDISNAEKFVEMYGNKIRWSRDYGGWFIYNSKYWERDINGSIKKYAIEVHRQLHREVQEFEGDDAALAAFSRHVKASGANGKLEAMLDCSKAFLGVPQSMFDAKEELFNLGNKTMNLDPGEDGKIRSAPFSPDDLLTKIARVDFNGAAKCPLWDKFLQDIFLGNEDMIDFMQRVVGYSMTASTREQCLFILYGCGRNGKSIFIDTIAHMFGDYAVNCPTNALIKKNYTGGIPNDVAALKGARFVTATESNQNVTLDEALIKQLTRIANHLEGSEQDTPDKVMGSFSEISKEEQEDLKSIAKDFDSWFEQMTVNFDLRTQYPDKFDLQTIKNLSRHAWNANK